jgi:hypothetical protein
MDDSTLTAVIGVQGALLVAMITIEFATYSRVGKLYARLDKIQAVVKILTREHAINHGGKEIDI